MKVLIELPDNWLDTDLSNNLDWITRTVKQEVRHQLVKALVDQVVVPKIEFSEEELQSLVLDKVAMLQAEKINDAHYE